jgi:hypothetical protein
MDSFLVAQTRATGDRILLVRFNTVLRLKNRGNSALGIPGIGLMQRILGEKQNIGPFLRRRDCGPQTRDAPTDDQHIRQLLRQTRSLE